MKVDPRFLRHTGLEVFTGNELLIKGCLEVAGGTHLLTGYPGSPVAGFFDTAEEIADLLRENGIRAALANNEAHAVAMVNGSQMTGLRSVAIFKSVGLHVGSDALALGNLAGAHPDGGAVIIVGDDPWSESTQVPVDSRYLFKHLMTPVMEPATMQELKNWVDLAFRLSREAELYIGYLVTTNQVDGGGMVTVQPNQSPQINTRQRIELNTEKLRIEDMVLLPPRTWRKEQDLTARFHRLWHSTRDLAINRTLLPDRPHPNRHEIGFVTAGQSYNYLEHALSELGFSGQLPILKLGITYPLDPTLILEFAGRVENLFVIEERRGFLEEQIGLLLYEHAQLQPDFKRPALYGKTFPGGQDGLPSTRGLNPSILIEKMGPVLLALRDPALRVDRSRIDAELDLVRRTAAFDINLIPRTPTFCPGCPHRDSASVLMEMKRQFRDPVYMQRQHQHGPVDLLFHGDTGCYTMLMFEPTKSLMHNYSGMGLGGATGAGIDPFITNKQVVFMGDSTFFHSGVTAISNSLKNGQDITYIILDNQTTGMTGHQTTPGLARGLMRESTFQQNIDRIVVGLLAGETAHPEVIRANPADRAGWKQLLESTILKSGVKVLIADKECGITHHRNEARRQRDLIRKQGFLPQQRQINITPEVCEFCLECAETTGCPGLTLLRTPAGTKMQTDLSWCVADGACTKLKVCPAFEEITIVRTQKPIPRLAQLDLKSIPDPKIPGLDRPYRIYLTGVGGMGIGLATATLVRAAYQQGCDVLFCDKKGLAIRNGGVYSQITLKPRGSNHTSNLIPYGKADLILGVDILEAVRSMDPKVPLRVGSPDYTTAIINTHKQPTILTLLGRDNFDPGQLEEILRRHTKRDAYFGFNVSETSERLLGTQIYANIIMLGIAFQRGLLPLSLESLEWAIQNTMGESATTNLDAFRLGRKIVDAPETVAAVAGSSDDIEKTGSVEQVVADKIEILTRTKRHGVPLARAYRELVSEAMQQIRVAASVQCNLALCLYDLIQFDGPAYAKTFLDRVRSVHSKDQAAHGFSATAAAITGLHRVMVIKDEVYVAHLLTSEEKQRRDRARHQVDPARGDRIRYRHINRPHFDFLGVPLEFDLRGRQWQMRLMRHLKLLRRLFPGWHQPEREFRDWYCELLKEFHYHDSAGYQIWLEILQLPIHATGYRQVRYPKMVRARQRATELLDQLRPHPVASPTVPTAPSLVTTHSQ